MIIMVGDKVYYTVPYEGEPVTFETYEDAETFVTEVLK